MPRVKKNKVLHSIYCNTMSLLVKNANELNILKEDIVLITTIGEGRDKQYVMLYYYGETD